jgi:hypothetical protein
MVANWRAMIARSLSATRFEPGRLMSAFRPPLAFSETASGA